MMTHLTRNPISVDSLLAEVHSVERGGTCVFLGTVRDDDDVTGIEYSVRSEEHTSELQSQSNLVCRLLLEKKKKRQDEATIQIYAAYLIRDGQLIVACVSLSTDTR